MDSGIIENRRALVAFAELINEHSDKPVDEYAEVLKGTYPQILEGIAEGEYDDEADFDADFDAEDFTENFSEDAEGAYSAVIDKFQEKYGLTDENAQNLAVLMTDEVDFDAACD